MAGPSTANLNSYSPSRQVFSDASGVENAFLGGLGNANLNPLADVVQGINAGIDLGTKANKFIDSVGPQAAEEKLLDLETKRARAQQAQAQAQITGYQANIAASTSTLDAQNAVLEAQKKHSDMTFQSQMGTVLSDAYSNLPQIQDPQSFFDFTSQPKYNVLRANPDYQKIIASTATNLLGTTNDPATQIRLVEAAEAASPGAAKNLLPLLPTSTREVYADPAKLAQIKQAESTAALNNAKAGQITDAKAAAQAAANQPGYDPLKDALSAMNGDGATPTQGAPAPGTAPAPAGQAPVVPGAPQQSPYGANPGVGTQSGPTGQPGAPAQAPTGVPAAQTADASAPGADQEHPALQPTLDAAKAEDSKKAWLDRFLQTPDTPAAQKFQKILNDTIKQHPDWKPEQQITAAKEMAKINTLSPAEYKDRSTFLSATDSLNTNRMRLEAAFKTIDSYIDKYGDAELGPGYTIDNIITRASNNLGAANPDTVALLNAKKELDAVGLNSAYQMMSTMHLGNTATMLNSPGEQAAAKALFTGSDISYERNKQAFEVLSGKNQEAQDMVNVVDAYMKAGYSYQDATRAADIYRRANPALHVDEINGIPSVTRLPNRTGVGDYIYNTLQIDKYMQRKPDGRAVTTKPADVHSFADSVANQIAAGQPVDRGKASDIADKMPEANEALMKRLWFAESPHTPDGIINPSATSSAGAQGVGQLEPATGKMLWKEFGFEGEYNPFDVKKNLLMSTAYMNHMLTQFNGDTRLALAAYNAGPGRVKEVINAYNKADRFLNNTSFDAVANYLPQETQQYVKRIMGDGDLKKERPSLTPSETASAYASLPSTKAQIAAQQNLSGDGAYLLHKTANIDNFHDSAGTVLDPVVTALIQANPFSPSEAEAQNTDQPGNATANPSTKTEKPAPKEEDPNSLVNTAARGAFAVPRLQAMAMGAARSMMFGFDDEAGALLRMAVHGEDYETAHKVTQQIQQQIYDQHKGLYIAGEAGGALASGATVSKGLAGARTGLQAGLAKLGFGAAAKAAPEAVPAVEAALETAQQGRSLLQTATQGLGTGIGAGAAFGAAQGAGDAPEGQREYGAAKGAVTGAITGAILTPVINLAGNALANSKTVQTVLNKIAQWRGKPTASTPKIEFDDAEKAVLNHMRGMSDEQLQEMSATLGENPASTIASESGTGLTQAVLQDVAKSADIGLPQIQGAAEKALEGTNPRVEAKLNQYADDVSAPMAYDALGGVIKASAQKAEIPKINAASAIYKDAQDRLYQVEENVNKAIFKSAEAPDSQAVYDRAATAVQGQLQAVKNLKDEVRKKLYSEAEQFALDNAPRMPDYTKLRTQFSAAPEEEGVPFIVDEFGRTVRNQTKVPLYAHNQDLVPAFGSDAVFNALKNEKVGNAIEAAYKEIGDRSLPPNSFEVLQKAKAILANEGRQGDYNSAAAVKKLASAMYEENPKYKAADIAFSKISDAIDSVRSKAFEALNKFNDPNKVIDSSKFGDALLKVGPKELSEIVRPNADDFRAAYPGASKEAYAAIEQADAESRKALADAAKVNLREKYTGIESKIPGQGYSLPNIDKTNLPKRLDVLLGDEATQIRDKLSQIHAEAEGAKAVVEARPPSADGIIPKKLASTLDAAGNEENPLLKQYGQNWNAAKAQSTTDNEAARRFLLKYTDEEGRVNSLAMGKDLFKIGPEELKALIAEAPEQQKAFQNAAAAALKDQLRSRPSRQYGEPQAFPRFDQGQLPQQLRSIFGEDAAKDILKTFDQEARIANSSNATLRQRPNETTYQAPTGREAGKAALTLAGAAAYQSPFMAGYAARQSMSALSAALTNRRIASEAELGRTLAEFLTDQGAQIDFLDKVLASTKPEIDQATKSVVESLRNRLIGGASQGVVEEKANRRQHFNTGRKK